MTSGVSGARAKIDDSPPGWEVIFYRAWQRETTDEMDEFAKSFVVLAMSVLDIGGSGAGYGFYD